MPTIVKPLDNYTSLFIIDDADLSQCPTAVQINPKSTVTLGDLHSNPMKLLYFFIVTGIVELDGGAVTYQELSSFYSDIKTTNDSCEAIRKKFANTMNNQITSEEYQDAKLEHDENLQKAVEDHEYSRAMYLRTVNEKVRLIENSPNFRLLGDCLADRGTSDLCVLAVLKKANQVIGQNEDKNNIRKGEIIFSNHDEVFSRIFPPSGFVGENKMPKNILQQYVSTLKDMYNSINFDGAIEFIAEELKASGYYESLKLLSYTIHPAQPPETKVSFNLNTHAPVHMGHILAVATKLGIRLDIEKVTSDPYELANLIDTMNNKFKYVMDNIHIKKLDELLLEFIYFRSNEDDPKIIEKSTLLKTSDVPVSGFNLQFRHGHDGFVQSVKDRRICLDNIFGKVDTNQTSGLDKPKQAMQMDFLTSPRSKRKFK